MKTTTCIGLILIVAVPVTGQQSGESDVAFRPQEMTWAQVTETPDLQKALPENDHGKYTARMEYVDEQVIIEARKGYERIEQDAREALLRGETYADPFGGDENLLTDMSHESPRAGAPEAGPRAVTTWKGITSGWRPSDSVLAVGQNHVGVMVNSRLAFYTKDGQLARGPTNLSSWFINAPHSKLFDPKIVYDVHEDRWVMLALNGTTESETYFALSVSQTADPTGSWWTWYLRSDKDGSTNTNLWADYPGLGYDSGNTSTGSSGGAVYITTNQFTFSGSFQYAKLRILKKSQLYTGSSVGWRDFWDEKNKDGSKVSTWKPVQTYSSTGTVKEYLVNTYFGGASWVSLWTLSDPVGTPSLTRRHVATNSYQIPPRARQKGGGSTLLLDTGDCRTHDACYRGGYIAFSCADKANWNTPATTEAVMHVFKFKASDPTDKPWDNKLGSDTFFYHYANVQLRASGEGVISFSKSGSTLYTQARVGVVPVKLTTWQSSLIRTGQATYNPTSDTVDRWGDYSGVGIDPVDDTGAFAMSQIAKSTTSWETWIGALDVDATETGACCHPDGTCTIATQAGCNSAGGAYHGDGTSCVPNPCPTPNPGDDCAAPITINLPAALPYSMSESTCTSLDDYNQTCMGTFDGGEDYLYKLVVSEDTCIDVTLNSAANTLLGLAIDNTCPPGAACTAVSASAADPETITALELSAGTYYLMVDASVGCGDFDLTITECPCAVTCVGTAEGEPDCGTDHIDDFNGGCNSDPDVFSTLACGDTICGRAGTYLRNVQDRSRDTDWYEVTLADWGKLEITIEAEFRVVSGLVPTDPLGTGDCADSVGSVRPSMTVGPCDTDTLTTDCLPPGKHWVFVAPKGFEGVACGSVYELTVRCVQNDSDGDGVVDCNDGCPNDGNKTSPGVCGCGVSDRDSDGDGTANCKDGCPSDRYKTSRGICGCGVSDGDSDGDGFIDCFDDCPNDPNKLSGGLCGCGVPDTDRDGDGRVDCRDDCPDDPDKVIPGDCGCGVPDDIDGDGITDCGTPAPLAPPGTGCGCIAGFSELACCCWLAYMYGLRRRRRAVMTRRSEGSGLDRDPGLS